MSESPQHKRVGVLGAPLRWPSRLRPARAWKFIAGYGRIKHELCQRYQRPVDHRGLPKPGPQCCADSTKFLFRVSKAPLARTVQCGAAVPASLIATASIMASRSARGLTQTSPIADPARRDFLKLAGALTASAIGSSTRAW